MPHDTTPGSEKDTPDIRSFLQWEAASRDTIDVKRCYIDAADGDLVAGILLSQILYYYLPTRDGRPHKLSVQHDGEYWLVKRREDWWEECRITPKQFDRASTVLIALGLIAISRHRFNGSPTLHVKACLPQIVLRVKSILTKGEDRTLPKGKIELDEKGRSLSSEETTTETTTEIIKTPDRSLRDLSSPTPLRQTKKSHRRQPPGEDAQQVLSHLRQVTGRDFTNADQIQKLLNSGAVSEDCLLVVDWLHAVRRKEDPEWCERYFDNVTPFRIANFDKYRARALVWRTQWVNGSPPLQNGEPGKRRAFIDGKEVWMVERKEMVL